MTVEDELNLLFRGSNNEFITMAFTEHNTVWGITYAFDDEPDEAHALAKGQNLRFQLHKKGDGSPTVLRVFFHFTNESGTGGSYDEHMSGSLGGNFDEVPAREQEGDLVPQNIYTFQV
jgi:hypothetical protein